MTRFRNHKQTNERNLDDYRAKEIYLFTVNYHFKNYSSALFIRRVIYNLFALSYPYDFDLLLVGPVTDDKNMVYGNGLPALGFYSYHSLTVAINMFPAQCGYKYAGYFQVNDDSCLQPFYLGKEPHNQPMAETWQNWNINLHWVWNKKLNTNNIPYYKAFLNAVDEIDRSISLKSLCKYNKTKLRKGWSDFFYIPSSNVSSYLMLEKVFFAHKVFLENAIPFIMNCLNAKVITTCNHGTMSNREYCVHLHPVKFSRSYEREICINRVTNISLSERPNTWYFVCCICTAIYDLRKSIVLKSALSILRVHRKTQSTCITCRG